MKHFLRSTLALICIAIFSTFSYAQEKAPDVPAENEIFQHISEYLNLQPLPMPDNSRITGKDVEEFIEPDHNQVYTGSGSRSSNSSTEYYDLTNFSGYTYASQGLTFSPYIYGTSGYSYNWQPTTITLPDPATSVTINTYGYIYYQWYYYWYYYSNIALYAYDINGNQIASSINFNGYYTDVTVTAPAGQEIAYVVLQNYYYSNVNYYYTFARHMWVTYAETNQAPVAIAQDVSVDASDNCDAAVSVSDVDNGSYDPDGDALTYSVSPAGPYSLGTTNVTLTVSDGELSSSASAVVTVNDVTLPVPDLATLSDVTGECDATVTSAPTATDNCSGALTATTNDPLYYDQQGTYTINWTYDDGNGNTSTQSQTVIIDDVTDPVADLATLPDVTGECDATVTSAPTATDNCAGALTATTTDPLYYDQQGTYTVNWTYDDGNGNTSTQSQTVIVDDVTAPVITATANPITLWPPNHKYHTVNVSECFSSISDNCASLSNSDVIIVKVTSDEPEDANGGGDGNTTDDMVIASDCKSVDLRKERQGNGNGRVYTIHMEIDDGNGNTGTATYLVLVPKNKNGTAVDDGAVYEVLGNCGAKSAVASGYGVINDVTMNAYPNPTHSNAIVEFTLSESDHVTVSVYNIMGLKVATLFDSNVESDLTNKLVFDGSYLPKGIYIIKLQSSNAVSKTTKLILNK